MLICLRKQKKRIYMKKSKKMGSNSCDVSRVNCSPPISSSYWTSACCSDTESCCADNVGNSVCCAAGETCFGLKVNSHWANGICCPAGTQGSCSNAATSVCSCCKAPQTPCGGACCNGDQICTFDATNTITGTCA